MDAAQREQRYARTLKDNLLKRKAQKRARQKANSLLEDQSHPQSPLLYLNEINQKNNEPSDDHFAKSGKTSRMADKF